MLLPENFDTLCHVNADLSHLPKTARTNSVGQTYWTVEFDIILLVGLTEMEAQISWEKKVSSLIWIAVLRTLL